MNEADDTSEVSPTLKAPSFGVSHPALSQDEIYQTLLKLDKNHSVAPIASNLAKELNDLLTRIMGTLASLPKTKDNAVEQAEAAVSEAREITKRLQSLNASEAASKREVRVGPIVENVIANLGSSSVAKCEYAVDPALPAIECDPAELIQVLSNLVRNATEAMVPPPHNPTIQVTAERVQLSASEIADLKEGTYVKLEVRDNGSGISPEIIQQIWDPFFTTKKHGSGLGLPTSLEIIRRLEGIIGVTSEVGVGTVFSVFIPVTAKPVQLKATQAPSVRFKTGRLLIVDKDPEIRHVLARMLEVLDYRSDGARDLEETLQQYKRYFEISRPYDAVLVDLTLTGTSGEHVLSALKAYDSEVRVIALSTISHKTLLEDTLNQGFLGVLLKPFKKSELGEVLKTVLGS